jgi:ribosomal protein S11
MYEKKNNLYFSKKNRSRYYLKHKKKYFIKHKLIALFYKKKKKFIYKKKLLLTFLLLRPTWRITLIRSKNNFFFLGSSYTGNLIFWFTGKQLGFKRRQLKSPYTIDAFYELFFYLLKKYNVQIIFCQLLGKKKLFKELLEKLLNLKYFFIVVKKLLPISFNGTKRRHKRRL